MLKNLPETNNSSQYLVRHAKYLAIIVVVWVLSATGQILAEIVLPDPQLKTPLPVITISDPFPQDSSTSVSAYTYNFWDIESAIPSPYTGVSRSYPSPLNGVRSYNGLDIERAIHNPNLIKNYPVNIADLEIKGVNP